MKKKLVSFFCLLLISRLVGARTDNANYSVSFMGSMATANHQPFWFVSQQNGLLSQDKNAGYSLFSITQDIQKTKKWNYRIAADAVFSVNNYSRFFFNQLYLDINYYNLQLSIGNKIKKNDITNEQLGTGNFDFSQNARPIPEINLGLKEFVPIPFTNERLHVKGDFALGYYFDKSYVNDQVDKIRLQTYTDKILLHHKSLYLKYEDKTKENHFSFIAGLQHIVQWGGVVHSPNGTFKNPTDWTNFIRVLFGKEGAGNALKTDQQNALGNQLGSFSGRLNYTHKRWGDFGLYWSHLFDDGSGMNLKQWFVDGILGVEYKPVNHSFISNLLYEYIHTTYQTGSIHWLTYNNPSAPYSVGCDNYYNNGVYTQGWSYYGRSVGNSLFTSPSATSSLRFQNNRIIGHHFGVNGRLNSVLKYTLKATFTENYGTHETPYLQIKKNQYYFLRLSYQLNDWELSTQIAADRDAILGHTFGGAIGLRKTGVFN